VFFSEHNLHCILTHLILYSTTADIADERRLFITVMTSCHTSEVYVNRLEITVTLLLCGSLTSFYSSM